MTDPRYRTGNFLPGIALLLALLIATMSALVMARAASVLGGEELVSALRDGGYHIYFRHEATDWSQDDHVTRTDDWLSCDGGSIRQLSDRGRERARGTGEAMKKLGIPVGRVLASPYCRTMETARLMDLGSVEATDAVINMRIAHFFGGRDAIIATARRLLSSATEAGGNTVIVAHGNVARDATPVYPDEGEAVIFKPDARGGFDFVGRLTHEQWVQQASKARPR